MSARALGPFQVAALLISASYGIGFLFGSGEMAIQHGMGGALYGIATAAGMLLLAIVAKPLWAAGGPVWTVFGRLYGAQVERAVAMLSLLWMAGVLAAQIHGGLAIAQQLGAPLWVSFGLVLLLIFGASMVNLGVAAAIFGICLLMSAAVLLFALASFDGVAIYLDSLHRFAADVSTYLPAEVAAVMVAVTLLVCTGADYQQFVIAARNPHLAMIGCLVAAVGLIVVAFLPPAVVLALAERGSIVVAGEARQVIPMALEKAAAQIGPGAGLMMLLALSAAALGSGAAILRAMSDALQSGIGRRWRHSTVQAAAVCLLAGAALASRGQGIVQTMVSVNIVYLASIGVVLATVVIRRSLPRRLASASMLAGFVTSMGMYLTQWAGWLSGSGDLQTLAWGLLASVGVLLGGRIAALLGFVVAKAPR